MAETVLVTGGAGYLGSILVPQLLAAGFWVTVLDDFRHGVNSLAAVCADPHFEVVRGDCRDAATVRPLAAQADWVIPLAGLVGAPLCARDELGATTTNRDAIRMLVGLLSREQRVVFPGTNSGYGLGDPNAVRDETSPLRPLSLYGRTKAEAEAIVMAFGNSISFRLATVFGMSPRMRTDLLVNDFTLRALRDGTVTIFEGHFKRTFIHIRDVADGFLHGMGNFGKMRNQIYNMGLAEANLSKLELAERIRREVPQFTYVEAPIGEDPDQRDYVLSYAKLDGTGWRPQRSLENGIRELIKGYSMLGDAREGNV